VIFGVQFGANHHKLAIAQFWTNCRNLVAFSQDVGDGRSMDIAVVVIH
jgi:hypothetical protein